jgi:hypothetical protein
MRLAEANMREENSDLRMNHPAVAKVFDAGSPADGQPYFVVEYVRWSRDHPVLR